MPYLTSHKKYLIFALFAFVLFVPAFAHAEKITNENGTFYTSTDCDDECNADTHVCNVAPKPWPDDIAGTPFACNPKQTPQQQQQQFTQNVLDFFGNVLEPLSNLIINLSGSVMGLTARFMNFSCVDITINGFSDFVKGTSSINISWTLIRDTVTMALGFVVLFAAFCLTYGIKGPGKGIVAGVIAVGFLINFTFFFASFGIDVSRITSRELWSPIERISQVSGTQENSQLGFSATGLSGAYVKAMKLTTMRSSAVKGFGDPMRNVIINLMGSVFLLVAAFVFGAGGVLCMQVFVQWIFLLATSPLMVFGLLQLGGSAQGLDQKWLKVWWESLTFLPVFLLLNLISILIIFDPFFQKMTENENFPDSFLGGSITIIFNFGIAMSFMIASLLLARQLTSSTGAVVGKWAGKAVGRVALGGAAKAGRAAFGWTATKVTDKYGKQLGARAAQGGVAGFFAKGTLKSADYLGKASFDVRRAPGFKGLESMAGVDFGAAKAGGYRDRKEEKAKKKEELIKKYVGGPSDETRREQANAQKEVDRFEKDPGLEKSKQTVDKAQKELDEAKKELEKAKAGTSRAEEEIKAAEKELVDLDKAIDEAYKKGEVLEASNLNRRKQAVESAKTRAQAELANANTSKATAEARVRGQENIIKGEMYTKYQTAVKDLGEANKKAKDETELSRRQYAARLEGQWWRFGSTKEAARRTREGRKTQDQQLLDLIKRVAKEEQDKQQKSGGPSPAPGGGPQPQPA